MRNKRSGQAVLLVVAGMSIFLMGAVGLAVDGSHLYVQRQLAQAAADAAAQAGIMSIFVGTNTGGAHPFAVGTGTPYTYTCSGLADAATPCYYAQTLNRFNVTGDTVTYVANPAGITFASLSPAYPVKVLQVTVTRSVPATVMKLLNWNSFAIAATGVAAIISVDSPIPIIVTHPTMSGSINAGGSGNGTACDGTSESGVKITICGGGPQSIQVNSASATAVAWNGNPVFDLAHAGPTGNGGSFGVTGGPNGANALMGCSGTQISGCTYLGTAGFYIDPAPPIADPLAGVAAPTDPSLGAPGGATNPAPVANAYAPGSNGCPAIATTNCTLYFPGKYTSPISISGAGGGKKWVVFAPGIYYMLGVDFSIASNGNVYSATGLVDGVKTATPSIANCCGTGTGWGAAANVPANAGMLVYMTGTGGTPTIGAISVSANSNVNLVGSPNNSSYKGILFFADRAAASQTHSLNGGGGLTLTGTIYTTSSNNNATYQTLRFGGNSGSNTQVTGEIITSALDLQGTPNLRMYLSSVPAYLVSKVALIQ